VTINWRDDRFRHWRDDRFRNWRDDRFRNWRDDRFRNWRDVRWIHSSDVDVVVQVDNGKDLRLKAKVWAFRKWKRVEDKDSK
jgi:hypothetical protein